MLDSCRTLCSPTPGSNRFHLRTSCDLWRSLLTLPLFFYALQLRNRARTDSIRWKIYVSLIIKVYSVCKQFQPWVNNYKFLSSFKIFHLLWKSNRNWPTIYISQFIIDLNTILLAYRVFKVRARLTLACSACCNCNCNCHAAASCQLTERERGWGCETEKERQCDRKSGEGATECEAFLLPFDGFFLIKLRCSRWWRSQRGRINCSALWSEQLQQLFQLFPCPPSSWASRITQTVCK